MYAITEIRQIYAVDSPKREVAAGIISELIYFPLSAYATAILIK